MVTTRTIQPWLKWYPQDWRADPALHACSLAARGLWIELIGLMHESHPYGLLLIGGRQPSNAEIGRLVGVHHNVVTALVTELVTRGVAGVSPSGVIYSRRMLRDHEKALKNKENGAKGGNPLLTETVNPPDKAKRLEARDQRPEAREKEPPIGGIVAEAPRVSPRKPSKGKPMLPLPEDYPFLPAHQEQAAARGFTDEREIQAHFCKFRNHFWERQDRKSANWLLGWGSWLDRQNEWLAKERRIERERANAGSYGD